MKWVRVEQPVAWFSFELGPWLLERRSLGMKVKSSCCPWPDRRWICLPVTMNGPFYRVSEWLSWPCSAQSHFRHHYCSFQYSCQSAQLAKKGLSVSMTCFLDYDWYFTHPWGCATSFSWVLSAYFALISSKTGSAWPQLFASDGSASSLSWLLLVSWLRERAWRLIWASS